VKPSQFYIALYAIGLVLFVVWMVSVALAATGIVTQAISPVLLFASVAAIIVAKVLGGRAFRRSVGR